jgi:hypothetical protein
MRRLGQSAIGDLGLFSATLGQVWGALSGIWIVNHLNRKAQHGIETEASSSHESARPLSSAEANGIADAEVRRPRFPGPKGLLRIFLLFLLPLSAVFIAMTAKEGLGIVAIYTPRALFLGDIPLFSLALLCAFPVRWIAIRAGILTAENCETIQNINGRQLTVNGQKGGEGQMGKQYKPGQISPVSAQVEIVGSRGGKTGEERTVVRNEPFPPTPKPHQTYLVTDRTHNRAGKNK